MSSIRIDEAPDAYLETLTLLQDEIARLEEELRLRDEASTSLAASVEPTPQAPPDDHRIDELTALLAERDETIALLWDQLNALEEMQVARSAEWDQLNTWVAELEARFGTDDDEPARDPDAGRDTREAEALRDRLEFERRTWDAERAGLEREVAGLRDRLSAASQHGEDAGHAALEEENRRLVEQCRKLATLEAGAAEAGTLREQLEVLREHLQIARDELGRAQDELQRQRMEHQAELAELRTRLTTHRATDDGQASPDERIRALRQHLKDVHEREARERAERQLGNRLSKLWRRATTTR